MPECYDCGGDFRLFGDFLRHFAKEHVEPRKLSSSSNPGDLCETAFDNAAVLVGDLRHNYANEKMPQNKVRKNLKERKSRLTKNKKEEKKQNKAEKRQCEYCQKLIVVSFWTPHQRRHLGLKPFECELCQEGFTMNFNLKRHVQVVHNGIKPFKCDRCDRSYGDATDLKKHQQSACTHLNAPWKRFECQVCRKRFEFDWGLTNHLKSHLGVKRFTCYDCEMPIGSRSSLLYHFLSAHAVIKPFTCDDCHRSFTESVFLRQHNNVHHSGEGRDCPVCEKRFCTAARMKLHVRKVHQISDASAIIICQQSTEEEEENDPSVSQEIGKIYRTGFSEFSLTYF